MVVFMMQSVVFPKVAVATQTRLSIRFINHGVTKNTFDTPNTNIKHQTSTTQTNEKEEMDNAIESQWRKISQKRWFPSLKSIGLFTFYKNDMNQY